jgi:hypothetical protein
LSFPEGASLEQVAAPTSSGDDRSTRAGTIPALRFSEAAFHRHAGDAAPLVVSGVNNTIALDALDPSDLAQAFNLSAEAITLQFNGQPVAWRSGSLSDLGWSGLGLTPSGVPTEFPTLKQSTRLISEDGGETSFLVTEYTGSWAPVQGLTFDIPQTQPLSFAILPDGGFFAQGSLLAGFPDGTRLRGRLRWRDNAFEVAFESRDSSLASLKLLRPHLSAIPTADIPAAPDPTAQKALSDQLHKQRSFLTGFEALMLAEGPITGQSPVFSIRGPLPSTVSAWADRLSLQPTTLFSTAERAELARACFNSARRAEASEDLISVLEVLRDLFAIEANRPYVMGDSTYTADLKNDLSLAKERAWARARRLIR